MVIMTLPSQVNRLQKLTLASITHLSDLKASRLAMILCCDVQSLGTR